MSTYNWFNLNTLPAQPIGYEGELPRQIEWHGTLTFDQNSGHVQSPELFSGYPEAMPYFGVTYNMVAELHMPPPVHCTDIKYGPFPEDGRIEPDCSLLGDLIVMTGPRLLFNMNVDLGQQYLTGSMYIGNTASDFAAHTENSNVWLVDRLSSDIAEWYCVPFGCEGMTGYWSRDWTVPEPSSIMLLGLALLATLLVRRRRAS